LSQSFKFGSIGKKEQRKANRKAVGTDAWLRLDEGFAVRPCSVIDLSDTGVQVSTAAAQTVRGTFTLMMSRTAGTGRRARVVWRSGSLLGAVFL
jgi:hypothetical protein